jgi:hypothetical protein
MSVSGGNLIQWNDKSPNRNNFTIASGFRPPLYKDKFSGINFNANQVMISSTPVTTNSNTTIFFVGSIFNNRDDFDYILSFSNNDLSFRWNPRHNFGDNNDSDFCNDNRYIINGLPNTGRYDITRTTMVNFVVQRGGTGKLVLSTDITRWGDRFFKGIMYELIIFNKPLSPSHVQQVQTYLRSKWK